MKPRVTVCIREDGTFEILLNESGRDLLVSELQRLDRNCDHIHLDNFGAPEIDFATDVHLSDVAYRQGDNVLTTGKVLLRPDDWDTEQFPHVLSSAKG